MSESFKCGFVALVGPTNSGKSTFLNSALHEKVSIVSAKPQTTMRVVRGILNTPEAQLIFVDLPGLQKSLKDLNGALNQLATEQAGLCDAILWFFDSSQASCMRQIREMGNLVIKWGKTNKSICLLTKVDKIPKPTLLPMIAEISAMNLFNHVVPIAAMKDDGTDTVVKLALEMLPEGKPLYPTDRSTDRSEDFRIGELVREKIYRVTRQEVPYSVWIEVEKLPSNTTKKISSFMVRIHADSESRKRILVGHKGEVMKIVGTKAREDVEQMLGHQVCLKLQVDVDPEWRRNKAQVRNYLELGN